MPLLRKHVASFSCAAFCFLLLVTELKPTPARNTSSLGKLQQLDTELSLTQLHSITGAGLDSANPIPHSTLTDSPSCPTVICPSCPTVICPSCPDAEPCPICPKEP